MCNPRSRAKDFIVQVDVGTSRHLSKKKTIAKRHFLKANVTFRNHQTEEKLDILCPKINNHHPPECTPIFLSRHRVVCHPDSRVAYLGLRVQANPDPGTCLFGQTLTSPQFGQCPRCVLVNVNTSHNNNNNTSHITEHLALRVLLSSKYVVLCERLT